jgi:peptidoglycan/xylan/chitin deacetylase (PgdA/CDA1 family)
VPRVHFLYLHSVFRDEETTFHRLLCRLADSHTFISYSDAVARVVEGRVDRPYVTLSLDDGLTTCTRAAAIMNDVGARACFFLVTSMVGATDFSRVREFCAERLHKPPLEFLSWGDAEALLRQGHEIGSHTRTHANLAALGLDQLHEEVAGSAEEIHRLSPRVPRSIFSPGSLRAIYAHEPSSLQCSLRRRPRFCASAERGCYVRAGGPSISRRLACAAIT